MYKVTVNCLPDKKLSHLIIWAVIKRKEAQKEIIMDWEEILPDYYEEFVQRTKEKFNIQEKFFTFQSIEKIEKIEKM